MKKMVSFIGAGRRQEGETRTYQKTTYQFSDEATVETAILAEALVKRKEMAIEECVLIGTHGSSWGCLIEEAALDDDSLFALYDTLENQFETQSANEETLQTLGEALSLRWEMPVKCHLHSSEVLEENVTSILFGYVEALRSPSAPSGLLIDITHGFRSMPILLMAAVQTLDTLSPDGVGLEIIYGEFKKDAPSPVRYLKPVWDGVRFARALRLFNERFDGDLLADLIKEEWASGAYAIRRICNIIQANFVTKFDEAFSQLGNALDELSKKENPSCQISLVGEQLRDLHRRFTRPSTLHRRLLVLADGLAERRLWGQAITTLQLALEAYVFDSYGEAGYGNYEITKELTSEFGKSLSQKNRVHFHRLRDTRNAIAHGGGASGKGGKPQEGNLPTQYKTYAAFLKRIF